MSVSIPIRTSDRARGMSSSHCGQCSLQEFSVMEALRLADDMRRTAEQIESCMRPLVEAFGLSNVEYKAINCLASAGGTLMLKDLARQAGLERSRQTRFLDEMVKRGLLLRVRSPQDRRTATVRLTTVGQQLVEEVNHRLRRVPTQQSRFPIPSAIVCLMGLHGSV